MFSLECLRRIAILSAILLSVFLIFDTQPDYLRLTVVNWEQRRDREIAALLGEEARGSLAAYVAEETAGHVISLRSAEWSTFLKNTEQTLAGQPPTSEWKRSVGQKSSFRTLPMLFFPRNDARFAEVLAKPEMAGGFSYFQFDQETSSFPALELSVVETRYSVDDPPQQLIHPWRHAGWWCLLVGVALYGLLPWPQEHARELRFATPVRTFLTDFVGVLLFGSMTAIWAMLVLSPGIPGHGEWLQIVVLTSVFGLMTLAGAAIVWIALAQSQLRLEWNEVGLTIHTIRGSTSFAWVDLVSLDVVPVTSPTAKALRGAGLLFALVNWRAAGPALLIQTDSRALRFSTRQGSERTIDTGNAALRNLWNLVAELEGHSIAVTPAARELAETDQQFVAPVRWPVHVAVGILGLPILFALARSMAG